MSVTFILLQKWTFAGKFEICQISFLATYSVILDHAVVYELQSQILMQWYVQLVAKKRELTE
jgi:hypothetical protein